ncbi:hypothetical protein KIN20_017208 [Parelaphostrongylus tenuis]|uniref:Uncharacterized protein n=1 Tax=Parelaphostrongylus tenuis TaxID=148309 RepID=A0AAD5MHL9_PARTN|nr:hypothetical protein KIN20_017208 [Parelaphostrongylus tenuis]
MAPARWSRCEVFKSDNKGLSISKNVGGDVGAAETRRTIRNSSKHENTGEDVATRKSQRSISSSSKEEVSIEREIRS